MKHRTCGLRSPFGGRLHPTTCVRASFNLFYQPAGQAPGGVPRQENSRSPITRCLELSLTGQRPEHNQKPDAASKGASPASCSRRGGEPTTITKLFPKWLPSPQGPGGADRRGGRSDNQPSPLPSDPASYTPTHSHSPQRRTHPVWMTLSVRYTTVGARERRLFPAPPPATPTSAKRVWHSPLIPVPNTRAWTGVNEWGWCVYVYPFFPVPSLLSHTPPLGKHSSPNYLYKN